MSLLAGNALKELECAEVAISLAYSSAVVWVSSPACPGAPFPRSPPGEGHGCTWGKKAPFSTSPTFWGHSNDVVLER